MCEHISWIEKDGVLYYLDDAALQDKFIKEKLEGCKDNDYLGHGAIRKVYNLVGGKEYENRKIWNPDEYPEEIANKLRDYDRSFKYTFETYMQNDDLIYILVFAPDQLRVKACKQLLKQSPTNDNLTYIIEYAPDQWREKAWTQLLKQSPTNNDLTRIIFFAPDPWREKAWTQLLKQSPTNDNLTYIIAYAPDQWREKARTLLNDKLS